MRPITPRAKRLRQLSNYVCVALTSACLMACEGDDCPGSQIVLDAGDGLIDAALRDASEGKPDASDGGVALDAAVVVNSCRVLDEGDRVITRRFFDPQSNVSVAVHAQAAQLSWSQYSGGKSRLWSRWYGYGEQAVDGPDPIEPSNQVDAFSAPRSGGFLTIWSDDVSGHGELRARRSDDTGTTLDEASIPVTSDGTDHSKPVVAQGADGNFVVAYVASNPTRGSTLQLGPDAKPIGSARNIAGFGAIVGRPALVAFKTGYLLAWADSKTAGKDRRVHLQTLDASGAAVGTGVLVDSDGDAQGTIDIATASASGAVAWDVQIGGQRAEVRFRTFDTNAAPTGIEQNVTQFPESGLRPALVAARGGFLVAYRSLQASALRIALLDGRGKLVLADDKALTVAPLVDPNVALAMRITNDGEKIFVGWLDQAPDTTDYQLQRAWIGCD